MEFNGKVEYLAFLLDAFTNVLQLEVRLNVQERLHIVQKRCSIKVRIEEYNIGGQADGTTYFWLVKLDENRSLAALTT